MNRIAIDVICYFLEGNCMNPKLDYYKKRYNSVPQVGLFNFIKKVKRSWPIMVAFNRLMKVGQLAPEFEMKDLEGGEMQLSDFRGKFVVLEFGSYT
jgi:hypothetical protein